MNYLLVLWMFWFLVPAVAVDAGQKEPGKPFLHGLETTQTQTTTSILCRVMQIDVQYVQPQNKVNVSNANGNTVTNESYVCVMDTATKEQGTTGMAYGIELLDDILGQLNLQDDAQSWVSISDCIVDEANVVIRMLPNTKVTVVTKDDGDDSNRRRRRLAPSIGKSTVLVLRVTYRGKDPSLSAVDLAGSVFGLGDYPPASLNLAGQMEACSFGKLVLTPGVGDGIVDGVAEISIDERVWGDYSIRFLENLVVNKANRLFGTLSNKYEHVLIVVPELADLKFGGGGFLAYAFLRGNLSVYTDKWAGHITILAHEIGHNLNLHHSGLSHDGNEYGDESGYMGYGNDLEIKSCFNAQKHWSLGWFQDRARSLDVEDLPWAGYLAAFVDYNMTSLDQNILVNVGQSNPRLFLQYNRAKGINADTRELGDHVVIVRDTGSPSTNGGLPSWREGGITAGGAAFRYPDFGDRGVDLVMKVCEQVAGPPDLVWLSIHLDDGSQRSTCGDETTTLSAGPSSSQSSVPSLVPSTVPTGVPSSSPSTGPSESPSVEASASPSNGPSASSSAVPSGSPSAVPSGAPSVGPSAGPNSSPSGSPSALPSSGPSVGPSVDPSASPNVEPSSSPSSTPSTYYIASPSAGPSSSPSEVPSFGPSTAPSTAPSSYPSVVPSHSPSVDPSSNPSASPSVGASATPSSSPSQLPTSEGEHAPSENDGTDICDDDFPGSFFVNNRRGNMTCTWLMRNIDRRSRKWASEMCASDAFHVCAETCGKCSDNCRDATPDVTFFVNKNVGDQNCKWLSTRHRMSWRADHCREGKPAWELCPETCHDCLH
jgi:hypothetical protein